MPLTDANALISTAWSKLTTSLTPGLKSTLQAAAVKWRLVKTNYGPGSGVQYDIDLALADPVTDLSIAGSPGWGVLNRGQLQLLAPLYPTGANEWFASVSGIWKGSPVVRYMPGDIHLITLPLDGKAQSLRLGQFQAGVEATLDPQDPNSPKLKQGRLDVDLVLELIGPLQLTVTLRPVPAPPGIAGRYTGAVPEVPLKDGSDSSKGISVTGSLTVDVTSEIQITFTGEARTQVVGIPVGPTPIKITRTVPLPAAAARKIAPLGIVGLPASWGNDGLEALGGTRSADELLAFAGDVELSFAQHAPQVMDVAGKLIPYVYDAHYADGSVAKSRPTGFSGSDDTAIWTGHLLAAEAFRFNGGKGDVAAKPAVLSLIGAIEQLFAITKVSTGREGLLCRAALPTPLAEIVIEGPPENQGSMVAPPKGDEDNYYINVPLGGVEWCAQGRGGDPPSRDSHTGIFLGLGSAYVLGDDEIKAAAAPLITNLLNYVVNNGWTAPAPAGPPIGANTQYPVHTQFLTEMVQQLAFLKIGALANPDAFGAAYATAAKGSDCAWLPVWANTLDPIDEYFKFSLDHAAIGLLCWLETDPAIKPDYVSAFQILRQATGHHRNAYFNLWWILADPANRNDRSRGYGGATVADEALFLLSDLITRFKSVPGPSGSLPLKKNPDDGFLTAIEPRTDYVAFNGMGKDEGMLANLALPVSKRPGGDKDFLWQHHPFETGFSTAAQATPDPGNPNVEASGVDYLLPYWMAVYAGLV